MCLFILLLGKNKISPTKTDYPLSTPVLLPHAMFNSEARYEIR